MRECCSVRGRSTKCQKSGKMATCSCTFICNSGSRLLAFQRSSSNSGVGNYNSSRPISMASTSVKVSSGSTCHTNPRVIPTFLAGGITSQKLRNSPYFLNLRARIPSILFMIESLNFKNEPPNNIMRNPEGFQGRRVVESRFSYEAAASLLFVTAAFGMTMNIQFDVASSSVNSKIQAEDRCGDNYAGGRPSQDRNDDGEIPFDEQTKKDFRVNQLKKPYDVSIRAVKGYRLYMEDEYFVSEGGRFAAVFDGHGGNGVSRYLRENLYKHIRYYLYEESEEDYYSVSSINPSNNLSQPNDVSFDSKYTVPSIAHHIAALRSAFRSVEREVMSREHFQHVGSTAVAVMLHESENGSRTLISANIGDSRAVLSRRGKAINLTRDHKPNDEKEKARIMSLGETVEWDPYSEVYRVCNLSLSRAIGDSYAKPYVSSEVEIKRLPLGNDGADEFVVLASDGLWDVMDSEEVIHFVHQVLRAPVPLDENSAMTMKMRRRQMSRMLSNEAIRRGTGDNVCVIVVWLDKME